MNFFRSLINRVENERKRMKTLKNIFIIIYILFLDLIIYLFNNRIINSFIWYFYMLFRRFIFIYNNKASYDKEDIALTKKFIKDYEKAIKNKTIVLEKHWAIVNDGDRMWISNQWYSNGIIVQGQLIYPRKSDINNLTSIYHKAKKIK